jgi:hypothetical protein
VLVRGNGVRLEKQLSSARAVTLVKIIRGIAEILGAILLGGLGMTILGIVLVNAILGIGWVFMTGNRVVGPWFPLLLLIVFVLGLVCYTRLGGSIGRNIKPPPRS